MYSMESNIRSLDYYSSVLNTGGLVQYVLHSVILFRSILTNTYNIGASYIPDESEHDNEAYKVEASSKRWNSEDDESDQTEWMILDTDRLDTEKKNIHTRNGADDTIHLTDSGKMRRNKLLTDTYSQAKDRTDIAMYKMLGCNATNLHGEQTPHSHDTNRHRDVGTVREDMKQLDIEQFSSKPTDNEIVHLSCELVVHKPPKMKGRRKTKLPLNEDIDGMDILKVRKKKKRHYLNSSYKKNAISLDEVDSVQFYSQSRRQSEPSLHIYTEEEVDPYENKAFYNPYYTETGQPLAHDSRQNADIKRSTSNEQPEFDLIRSSLQPLRGRALPSLENVYHENISTSTWM